MQIWNVLSDMLPDHILRQTCIVVWIHSQTTNKEKSHSLLVSSSFKTSLSRSEDMISKIKNNHRWICMLPYVLCQIKHLASIPLFSLFSSWFWCLPLIVLIFVFVQASMFVMIFVFVAMFLFWWLSAFFKP